MTASSSTVFHIRRIRRFGIVGILNTAIGYGTILALLALGCGDILSNVAGYAAGLTCSFLLNGRWTFRNPAGFRPGTAARFGVTSLIAYGVNLAVILAARAAGHVDDPLVHLAGMGIYTILSYLGSAWFVFVPSGSRSAALPLRQAALARRWPEAAALVGLVAAFLLLRTIPLSHDVVWQMWIARQLIGGAGLYSQILELNPPLWFWMAVPVEWAAQHLAVSSGEAIIAAVFVLIAAALGLFSALLREQPSAQHGLLLAATFLAMVLLPLEDFGQREHLALVAAIPYLALIVRRAEGRPTNFAVAASAALLAAMGFALKHYFVLAPLLLELWLIGRQRRAWTPLRPELVVLCLAALGYAAAVVLFAPDFLTTIVPNLRLAYGGYEAPLLNQLARLHVVFWLLAALILWRRRDQASPLTLAAVIAAAAFCISYFAQQKGWRYHAIPASGCVFVALATLAPRQEWTLAGLMKTPGLAGALLLPVVAALLAGPYYNSRAAPVSELLKDGEPGAVAVMLTANPSNAWPMVEQAGLVWPSRHFTFWMLHAIAAEQKAEARLTPELAALADTVRRQTVEDLSCAPPDLILVDDFSRSKSKGFDVVRFFGEDAEFKRLFSHYEKVRTVAVYTSYRKVSDWRQETPEDCRPIR